MTPSALRLCLGDIRTAPAVGSLLLECHQPLRRASLAFIGASLLTCCLWARPADVWEPADALRAGTISAVADFNRDGSPDRVSSDRAVVSVSLSRFHHPAVQLIHVTPVVGLLAADVDRDGDIDVLTLTSSGRLRLWKNDGHGRFSAGIIVPRGSFHRHLPAGLAAVQGDALDPPGDGPGYKFQPAVLSAIAVMATPVRATPARAGSSSSPRRNWGARPASPRAPPVHAAA
jgi:hypothetical protein